MSHWLLRMVYLLQQPVVHMDNA